MKSKTYSKIMNKNLDLLDIYENEVIAFELMIKIYKSSIVFEKIQ
jgi:hypothetical protein